MVEEADTQAQETAGAGERGEKNKMQAVSGLCTWGDSHRFGAGKASFMGSIFSSKTEVIGGRGGDGLSWTWVLLFSA